MAFASPPKFTADQARRVAESRDDEWQDVSVRPTPHLTEARSVSCCDSLLARLEYRVSLTFSRLAGLNALAVPFLDDEAAELLRDLYRRTVLLDDEAETARQLHHGVCFAVEGIAAIITLGHEPALGVSVAA